MEKIIDKILELEYVNKMVIRKTQVKKVFDFDDMKIVMTFSNN